MNYFERKRILREQLERRVAILEKLVYEKTVTRGHDSRAYTIWKLLRDEGPMTRPQIRDRLGYTTPIVEMEQEDCVFKNGSIYSYNPDYNWEDVGVIPRTAEQELQNALRNSEIEDVDDEAPVEVTPRRRRSRSSDNTGDAPVRRTRAPRSVTPNLFSRKFAEVKAAVDDGQNVNQTNDAGKSPLIAAILHKEENLEIINYLLEHGANPEAVYGHTRKPALVAAINSGKIETAKALIAHGINLSRCSYKHQNVLSIAIESGLGNSNDLQYFINDTIFDGRPQQYDFWRYYEPICSSYITSGITSESIFRTVFSKLCDIYIQAEGLPSVLFSLHGVVTYITDELRRKHTSIMLDYALDHDVWPELLYGTIRYMTSDTYLCNTLYNAARRVVSESIAVKDREEFFLIAILVADKIGKSADFIYNILTPEYIRNLESAARSSLMGTAIESNNKKLFKLFLDANVTLTQQEADSLVVDLAGAADNISEEITKIGCRLLLKSKFKLSNYYSLYDICKSKNEYLVDFLIDQGYGQMLADSVRSSSQMSSMVRDKLKEAEVDMPGENGELTDASATARANRRRASGDKSDLISLIKSDDNFRSAQYILQRRPELLTDTDVVDTINDSNNDSSFTAVQLRRRLAELPKDTYDM